MLVCYGKGGDGSKSGRPCLCSIAALPLLDAAGSPSFFQWCAARPCSLQPAALCSLQPCAACSPVQPAACSPVEPVALPAACSLQFCQPCKRLACSPMRHRLPSHAARP